MAHKTLKSRRIWGRSASENRGKLLGDSYSLRTKKNSAVMSLSKKAESKTEGRESRSRESESRERFSIYCLGSLYLRESARTRLSGGCLLSICDTRIGARNSGVNGKQMNFLNQSPQEIDGQKSSSRILEREVRNWRWI